MRFSKESVRKFSEQQATLDHTPSGKVEYLTGADGKLRAYCRKVDHDLIVDEILDQIQQLKIPCLELGE